MTDPHWYIDAHDRFLSDVTPLVTLSVEGDACGYEWSVNAHGDGRGPGDWSTMASGEAPGIESAKLAAAEAWRRWARETAEAAGWRVTDNDENETLTSHLDLFPGEPVETVEATDAEFLSGLTSALDVVAGETTTGRFTEDGQVVWDDPVMQAAMDRLDAIESMAAPGWIPVAERLPEDFDAVVILAKECDGYVYRGLASYDAQYGKWIVNGGSGHGLTVSHWLALPPLPVVEVEE